MRCEMMVGVVVFLLLAPTASAWVALDYQENIFIVPAPNRTLSVVVNNPGESNLTLNVSCESGLSVSCPERIEIGAHGAEEFGMIIEPEDVGVYMLDFAVGGVDGRIEVKVSETPKTLLHILDRYNETLYELGKDAAALGVEGIEITGMILKDAYELYEKGSYYDVNERIEDIQEGINNISENISEKKLEMNMESLSREIEDGSFISLVAMCVPLCGLLAFLVIFQLSLHSKRNVRVNFSSDIHIIKDISTKKKNYSKDKIRRLSDVAEAKKAQGRKKGRTQGRG